MSMEVPFRTKTIDDDIEVQLCPDCGRPYAVAFSQTLERWIFICLVCNSSCSTIVGDNGEEIEITGGVI